MNIYESIRNSLNESRLPNISEFIYDLDVDKGNAWGVTNYGKTSNGRKIIEVYRNGYSENTAEDIKNIVEEKYPQLEGVISHFNNAVRFYLKESINESEVKHYNLMGDDVILDIPNKTMTVNGKTFTFEKMDEFAKASRGANRIYKPMALLLYIDYKNGKLRNWESEVLNEGAGDNSGALVSELDTYLKNRYGDNYVLIDNVNAEEGQQLLNTIVTQFLHQDQYEYEGQYDNIGDFVQDIIDDPHGLLEIETPMSESGERYQIRKTDGWRAPYGIWDTQEKKFVKYGEKGIDKPDGTHEDSPLELELHKRNEVAASKKEKLVS